MARRIWSINCCHARVDRQGWAYCRKGNWDKPVRKQPVNVGKVWQAECEDYVDYETGEVRKGGMS